MTSTTVGREPLQLVQIDQDYCAETYGSAPCTAAVPTTGAIKCFNTRKTCQDPDNFNRSTLTLTFAKPISNLPRDQIYFPTVQSVSTNPTVLNIGDASDDKGPLGTRATVTVVLKDHPDSDVVTDPYLSGRSYVASDQGTFWSKWLARNPYYQNRPLRVYDGYVGQAIGSMVVRNYLIESIDGPDSAGNVTIKAKDVLKLADDKRATAPAASPGELRSAITDSATSIDISNATTSDYPAPGTVRINDEVLTYTGVTDNTTYITLTGCVRGTDNTTAAAHSVNDAVQWCLRYEDQYCYEIAEDLLTTYGNISASYIPTADWTTEGSRWLSSFYFDDVLITEPVGVNKLLGELTRDCSFFIWWDERDQEIKMRAVRPNTDTPAEFTDNYTIIADSGRVNVRPQDRISQIWIYYNRIDPTQDVDKAASYLNLRIKADLNAESVNEYGEQRIEIIYSRFLQSLAQVATTQGRILSRFRNNPRVITIRADAKDRDTWTGDIVNLTSSLVTDVTGAQVSTQCQVISAREVESGTMVEYKLVFDDYAGQWGGWQDNAATDWASTTPADRTNKVYWTDANGENPDGSAGYGWT